MVTREHLLCLLLLFGCSPGNFAEEDDDTVSIEAAELPLQERTLSARNIDWMQKTSPGGVCLTSKGEVGQCTTFRDCYPYFKIPNLGSLDGWVLGVYDTCSYTREDGRMGFGVCCSGVPLTSPKPAGQDGPIVEDPQDVEDSNNKKDSPITWPPALPTHPPHHTIPPLPTHPPFASPGGVTSRPPIVTTTRRPTATTWPTKKPAWWPGAATPKPLVTTTSMSLSSSECGAKNGKQDQDRIVGGQNADPGEWPWIAALFNAGRQVCGGSLIDDKHILTAAHCVAHMNSWDVARLTVRLGDYNIKTNSEIEHIERRVKRVVRHKGFDPRTLYNDVAILTLNEPIEFSEMIRPICLPGGSQLYVGKTATVIGWGSLRESGPQPAVLQEVAIPVWPNSECKQKYGAAAPGGIVDSFLCAGRAAKDSCSGDSGGPLMVNDGRWTQVGIVSWGIGCGKGQYPGVYTRVTHFLPWIYKNLK
ncbi:proclotting enzyme [Diachasma alloeum]|uniref:proclotting enzyme n=1 Tax=Diachasma alloeum TaxID=454923 RepID=UPI00073829DA|nr:proclotting enzyme [Diachasma alloeum]